MSLHYSKSISRISQLLIILQVVLSCWNGQPVMAQTEVIGPVSSTYSDSYAYTLTGQGDRSEDNSNYYIGDIQTSTKISSDGLNAVTTDAGYAVQNYLGILSDEGDAYITPPSKQPWYRKLGKFLTALVMTPEQRALQSEAERFRQRLGHTATLLDNGKVLIVGGSNGYVPIWSPVLYDPATGQTTQVGGGNLGRVFHTATKLANGDVLILGGNIQDDSLIDSPHRYDGNQPIHDYYSNGQDGTSPTSDHSYVYKANENIFVTAEEYFTTSSFSSIWARVKQLAVLLPADKLLLVGGAALPKTFYEEAGYAGYDTNKYDYFGISPEEECLRSNSIKQLGYSPLGHGFDACWSINKSTLGTNDASVIDFKFSHQDLPITTPITRTPEPSTGKVNILLTVKVKGDASISSSQSSGLPIKTAQYYVSFPANSHADKSLSISLSPTDTNGDNIRSAKVLVEMRQWFSGNIRYNNPSDLEGVSNDLVIRKRWQANLIEASATVSQNRARPKVMLVVTGETDPFLADHESTGTGLVTKLKQAGFDNLVVLQNYGNLAGGIDAIQAQQTESTIYLTDAGKANQLGNLIALNDPATKMGLTINTAKVLKAGSYPVSETASRFAKKANVDIAKDVAAIIVINDDRQTNLVSSGDAMSGDEGGIEDATGLGGELMNLNNGTSEPIVGLPIGNRLATTTMSNGQVMIVNHDTGQLYIFDPATKSAKQVGRFSGGNIQIITNPSDSRTYILAGRLYLWDSAKNQPEPLDEPKFIGTRSEDFKNLSTELAKLVKVSKVDGEDRVTMTAYNQAIQRLIQLHPQDSNFIQQSFGGIDSLFSDFEVTNIEREWRGGVSVGRDRYFVIPLGMTSSEYISGRLITARLSLTKYIADLGNGRYFVSGDTGSTIWDVSNNTVEVVYAPSRIPLLVNGSQIVKGKPTAFALNYEYAQVTSLAGGNKILVTGGMVQNGQNVQSSTFGVSGDDESGIRALESNAVGASVGIGMVATGLISMVVNPLLGALIVAGGMGAVAVGVMSSLGSSSSTPTDPRCQSLVAPLSCFGVKSPTIYAHTAETNWLFQPDPFPNTIDETIKVTDISPQRDEATNPDLLAPPKEALVPSKPAPDQQVAGKNSGYKLELTFDKTELNPYSGSIVTGTVKAVNASGQIVPMQGAVNLYVGAGNSTLNLATNSEATISQLGASESHQFILTPDEWGTKSQPSGYYSPTGGVGNAGLGYVTGATTLAQISANTKGSTVPDTDNGQRSLSNLNAGVYTPVIQNKPIITLQNGVGTFTYQVYSHKYDNVTFAVTGQEQPIFKARDSKYVGTQTYIDNNPSKPLGLRADLEPMDVRNQRLSQVTGYQILPDLAVNIPKKVIPNQFNKSEPAGATSSIATVKTLKFADYKNSTPPTVDKEIISKAGYVYDIATNAPLAPKKGDKFTITITPKAKAGGSLPNDIYDGLKLEIMAGYSVYNKNYNTRVGQTNGQFINTVPALFAENSAINKAVKGGWLAPAGAFGTINFNIGKEPVTLELEYTGEPSQTNTVAFDLVVRDMHVIPIQDRFKGTGGGGLLPSLPIDIQKQIKQTMREVIALPFQ